MDDRVLVVAPYGVSYLVDKEKKKVVYVLSKDDSRVTYELLLSKKDVDDYWHVEAAEDGSLLLSHVTTTNTKQTLPWTPETPPTIPGHACMDCHLSIIYGDEVYKVKAKTLQAGGNFWKLKSCMYTVEDSKNVRKVKVYHCLMNLWRM